MGLRKMSLTSSRLEIRSAAGDSTTTKILKLALGHHVDSQEIALHSSPGIIRSSKMMQGRCLSSGRCERGRRIAFRRRLVLRYTARRSNRCLPRLAVAISRRRFCEKCGSRIAAESTPAKPAATSSNAASRAPDIRITPESSSSEPLWGERKPGRRG